MQRISRRNKVRREALSHSNQPLTLYATLLGWDYYVYVGVQLLCDYPLTRPLRCQATRDGEAHSSQELCRELCVQAPQAPYHAHQVDYRDLPLQFDVNCLPMDLEYIVSIPFRCGGCVMLSPY